jgi:uncharacterized protein
MSALQRANDATMDDIMASIRRIVGDDQPQKPVGFNNEPIRPANDFRAPLRPSTSPVYDLTDQVNLHDTRSLDPRKYVADVSFDERVLPNETMLSNKANAAVMASFEQLSQSFARSSGIMDEMVREMLKPMLKQWLDDNLPPLVEKLIRVEIERVARGGK